VFPPAGSHCQRPATNSTSTIASQNVGSDWPRIETICAIRSTAVPFLTAAMMPSGNAIAIETVIANVASFSEFGRRSPMSSLTGLRARIEVPKSPTTARPTNEKYCSR
jgi:hypothetical protein